jgi:integrase
MSTTRRTRGTGSITIKRGVYHGKWRVGTTQVMRRIGPVRKVGTSEGLTKSQAEAKLRKLMEATVGEPVIVERVTVEDAGVRLIAHLKALGRKRSTTEGYQSYLEQHLAPLFAGRALSTITATDVEAFMAHCRDNGQSVKSTLNYLGLLHGIFDFAIRHSWASSNNPCKLVDKPERLDADADVRFLDQPELDALLDAVPGDDLGRVERVMYLAAAMTGMCQGELIALRWQDVDWLARRIRVTRNYVRGEFGTPKSKRSTRKHPARRPARRRTGSPAPAHALEYGHQPRVRPPAHRQADRPLPAAEALQGGAQTRRRPRGALPRPAPHVRDADGSGRRADAHTAGVHGSPRLQDDADLRRLRAERR